ncbi:hypothetical protein M9H77_09418 [Catharanthus roseus]|uniref:Uncharacterized protein n=1 Tax=Catharanthus roseus TaxID=4058 RepID=A0ACC0C100_CATRO|nr:hypothetical protein M9H77_09418 [Catharanthus roseus]
MAAEISEMKSEMVIKAAAALKWYNKRENTVILTLKKTCYMALLRGSGIREASFDAHCIQKDLKGLGGIIWMRTTTAIGICCPQISQILVKRNKKTLVFRVRILEALAHPSRVAVQSPAMSSDGDRVSIVHPLVQSQESIPVTFGRREKEWKALSPSIRGVNRFRPCEYFQIQTQTLIVKHRLKPTPSGYKIYGPRPDPSGFRVGFLKKILQMIQKCLTLTRRCNWSGDRVFEGKALDAIKGWLRVTKRLPFGARDKVNKIFKQPCAFVGSLCSFGIALRSTDLGDDI